MGKSGGKDPAQYFKEGRIYVACEADEDIDHITQLVGEDCQTHLRAGLVLPSSPT